MPWRSRRLVHQNEGTVNRSQRPADAFDINAHFPRCPLEGIGPFANVLDILNALLSEFDRGIDGAYRKAPAIDGIIVFHMILYRSPICRSTMSRCSVCFFNAAC